MIRVNVMPNEYSGTLFGRRFVVAGIQIGGTPYAVAQGFCACWRYAPLSSMGARCDMGWNIKCSDSNCGQETWAANIVRSLIVLAPLALAGCASTLKSPDAVTQADIDRYQFGLYRDCQEAGAKHGQPQLRIDVFCNCAFETLKQNLSRSDWNRAVYYYLNGRDRDELQVISPIMAKVAMCRALPLPEPEGSAAVSQGPPSLVGRWGWTNPIDNCRETYTFRGNGTVRIESGNERTENTYRLSDTPETTGRIKITLTTTEYIGGMTCAGSSEDTTGKTITRYVLFGPENEMLAVCKSVADLDCVGPLDKLTDE
jgi:hypothetical protein